MDELFESMLKSSFPIYDDYYFKLAVLSIGYLVAISKFIV